MGDFISMRQCNFESLHGELHQLMERFSSQLDIPISTILAELENEDETSIILTLALISEYYSSLDIDNQLACAEEFRSDIQTIVDQME